MLSRKHAERITRVKRPPISAMAEFEIRAALTGPSHRPHAAAMSKTVINLKEATELQRLYAQLPQACRRAAAALRTSPPDHKLDGEALARFLEADKKAGDIARQIRKILGDE